MGLFRDLGEKVERFKQQAEQASRERAPYECADCGKAIHIERDDCPDCGSETILQRQPAGEPEAEGNGSPATDATDTENADSESQGNSDSGGTGSENATE